MSFSKLTYLISTILLTAVSLHANSTYASTSKTAFQASSLTTIHEGRSTNSPQFIAIEILETEKDNETETDSDVASDITTHNNPIFWAFPCICFTKSTVTPQSPILFYKSRQSFLEVFRI